MHFTTKSASDGYNLEDQKWYMLPFKSDFQETLIKHRRLPTSSLRSKLVVASTLSKIKTNLKID